MNRGDTNFDRVLDGRRAVIFDWDGTLVDNHLRNYRALRTALAPHQITIDQNWYREHCGLPIYDLLARLSAAAHLPIADVIAASRAGLLASTTPATLIPNTAVIGLAEHANSIGLPCAVASGAAAVLVDAGLDALSLRTLFRTVVTCEDVAHGKPAPDTFLEAARRLGTDPASCLAVDDAPDGIKAARRAGMRVLTIGHHNELVEIPSIEV